MSLFLRKLLRREGWLGPLESQNRLRGQDLKKKNKLPGAPEVKGAGPAGVRYRQQGHVPASCQPPHMKDLHPISRGFSPARVSLTCKQPQRPGGHRGLEGLERPCQGSAPLAVTWPTPAPLTELHALLEHTEGQRLLQALHWSLRGLPQGLKGALLLGERDLLILRGARGAAVYILCR